MSAWRKARGALFFNGKSNISIRKGVQTPPHCSSHRYSTYKGLPVVDIEALRRSDASSQDVAAIGKDIRDACSRFGFFYLTGTGLTLHERNGIFKAGRQLFALSETEKRAIPSISGGFTRGYIPIGGESGSHRFEVKEAFSYGYSWEAGSPPSNPLQGPNCWPDESLLDKCDGIRLNENCCALNNHIVANRSLESGA